MMEYLKIRNDDFMKECLRQKELAEQSGEKATVELITARAAASPAPGYYLNYDYARRCIGRWERKLVAGGETPRTQRARMIEEIGLKCLIMIELNPRLDLGKALSEVLLHEKASCYFMTEKQARWLYYSINRRRSKGRLNRGRRTA